MEVVLKNVSCKIKNHTILNDISLTLKDKKIYGLIGPSGSGKTTLIELISGLTKVTSGSIMRESAAAVCFQNPYEQFFHETVFEEITFGLKLRNVKEEIIDKSVAEITAALGINHELLTKNPFALSSGEAKIVSLAAIIVMDKDILILDEPTLGLDREHKELLRKYLVKIRKKKLTIVISHDINFLHRFIDDVIVLKNGALLISGNKYDIFKEEAFLVKEEIMVPEIMSLINLVNKKHSLEYYDDIKELMKAVYRDVK